LYDGLIIERRFEYFGNKEKNKSRKILRSGKLERQGF
jgi:hypothetical protein